MRPMFLDTPEIRACRTSILHACDIENLSVVDSMMAIVTTIPELLTMFYEPQSRLELLDLIIDQLRSDVRNGLQ